jgi:superfamily II DNA/RNA helicase
MNKDYLDESKTSAEILTETTNLPSEIISTFQSGHYSHLSNLQAAYLNVVSKGKKRILIECQFPQGKTTCFYMNLLSLLLNENSEESKGIYFIFKTPLNKNLNIKLQTKQTFT